MREIPIDARCLRCGFRLFWKVVLGNQAFLSLASSVVLILAFSAIANSQNVIKSQIVIEVRKKEIARLGLDKLYLDVRLVLKNVGTVPVTVDKVVVSSGRTKSASSVSLLPVRLDPDKETSFSSSLFGPLERQIGSDQVQATITVSDESANVIIEKGIRIPIPTLRIGNTIVEIEGTHDLSLTLTSWTKSNITVVGPFAGGTYYTYSARPGKKFIILFYTLRNNWIRPQGMPYFSLSGSEVATDKGYIYPVFYSGKRRRPSTKEEVERLSCPGGELLPEKSTRDCIVYEIPENEKPVEAIHSGLPFIIKFNKRTTKRLTKASLERVRAPEAKKRYTSKGRTVLRPGVYKVRYPTSVYAEPREDSRKVATIKEGTKVNVVSVEGDWLEIRSKHGRPPGFIKKVSVMPRKGR